MVVVSRQKDSRTWYCHKCHYSEMESSIDDEGDSPFKWRICKCPDCGISHNKRIFYTGPADPPPYRCNICDYRNKQSPINENECGHNIPKDLLKE